MKPTDFVHRCARCRRRRVVRWLEKPGGDCEQVCYKCVSQATVGQSALLWAENRGKKYQRL